jgi:hypothetical protein
MEPGKAGISLGVLIHTFCTEKLSPTKISRAIYSNLKLVIYFGLGLLVYNINGSIYYCR